MPGEFYIEGKKQKLDIAAILAAMAELEQKLEALVVFRGQATDDGAPDGSSIICSDLPTKADFNGNEVVITSGPCAGEARDIAAPTISGVIVPGTPFGNMVGQQVTTGTGFAILAIRTTPAEVAAIEAKLDDAGHGLAAIVNEINANEAKIDDLETKGDAIKSQSDKLAGKAPVSGSTIANWNVAESDVVSIGAGGTRHKLHSLLLSIYNLVGTTITVRLYMKVNGTERKVYEQAFNATSDPPGLWIVNGTVGIHEVLRVTLVSNNAADDGAAVEYDYMLEEM